MSAIISPLMQQDYVTKKEFGEFKGEINGRFDQVDRRFDESKTDTERYMGILREGFRDDLRVTNDWVKALTEKVSAIDQKIDSVDVKFENRFLHLDVRFDLFEEKVNERFDKIDDKFDRLDGKLDTLLRRSTKK